MVIFCLVFVSVLYGCFSNNYNIIDAKCGNCHKSDIVYLKSRSETEWQRIIYAMKLRGLVITDNEEEAIFKVLKDKKLITY
ncbi:MAG: hypothetical protein JG762_790 [Deferribacteraceae bacterium]|jgi:hypothetical protein|nr:hypothetical protein [Deferribacteraceae bacterium]